jgi:hypothetical protein
MTTIINFEWPDWFTASFVEKLVVRVALVFLVGRDVGVLA